MNTDRLTTIIGAVLASVLATNVDWQAVFDGDPRQISAVVVAVLVALLGYFTNKPVDPRVNRELESFTRSLISKVAKK